RGTALEAGGLLAPFARAVDQAVYGGGAGATLAAHHARRLAGEGREQDLAVDALGEVLGKRRLARSGITEEAKDRGAPARGFEPMRGRRQGGILVGREDRHRRPRRRSAEHKNRTGTFVKAWVRCADPTGHACARLRSITRRRIVPSTPRRALRPGSLANSRATTGPALRELPQGRVR